MPPIPDFTPAFRGLRAILAEYEPRLRIVHDKPDYYHLDTFRLGRNGKPIMFGAVRIRKTFVSYYLMAVYGQPGLLAGMSPALKKRMQGKACFNFKTVDQSLFKELADITRNGYRAWANIEWVD